MGPEAERILGLALALTKAERVVVLEALLDSLEAEPAELGPEWRAEIRRRIEAVERGESQLVPGDEVMARVRARLAAL